MAKSLKKCFYIDKLLYEKTMPQYFNICFSLFNILLEIQNKTHSANIFKS